MAKDKNTFGCSDVNLKAAACECDRNYKISDEERKRKKIYYFVVENCTRTTYRGIYSNSITMFGEHYRISDTEAWRAEHNLAKWVSEDKYIQDKFQ